MGLELSTSGKVNRSALILTVCHAFTSDSETTAYRSPFIRLEMPRPYLLGKKGIGVPNSFDSFHVESRSLKVRLTFPVTAIFTSCDVVEGALRLKPVFIS